LGFDAPLTSLRYWILGVPDPSSPAAEVIDVERRLASLQQSGWQIEYTDYAVVKGEWLPGRMTLLRDDVRVRLIVDHWAS
jgi:outer membrane lipoprotein LolB